MNSLNCEEFWTKPVGIMTVNMRILCTNDDGYNSNGIQALIGIAQRLGQAVAVAPGDQQSTMSNALTLYSPIRCTSFGKDFVVDGTPADCVIMATNELLEGPIDLCLSGINHGANMGEDVLYSGTVAGAMEAALSGIPAMSISYAGSTYDNLDDWSDLLVELIKNMLKEGLLRKNALFNVNLPAETSAQAKGVRMTSLGSRRYRNSITRCADISGEKYYQIGGGDLKWEGPPSSDYRAIRNGYVSITPVNLDLTDYSVLEGIKGWKVKS